MGLGLAVLILALRSVQEGRIAPTDLLLYPAGSALGSGLYRQLRRFAPDFCAQTEIRGTQCVLFSCLLLGEKVTPQMGVGFAVIFAALLFSELAPKKDA